MTSVSNNAREYCLRWNLHQPNLATYFSTLYSSESLVDVTLVSAEGRKLFAHKLILSACSHYFQVVFENNPCKHPVVILKDVPYSDLEVIVKFIYNGEVNISQDRINTILKTAGSLQVKGLAEVPVEEIAQMKRAGGESGISTIRSHQSTPLTSSASWDASDSGYDVPRKKLKKSASATASYVSGSPSTNGNHSASIDSGVGASVSRSIDEGGPLDEIPTVVHKRTSLPAPPPLLPKSKSLDHTHHRDTHEDHEMKASLADQQRQSYDDSSVGLDRGYDLEIADDNKMEREMDDGELEYLDEEEEYYDEEDSYGYNPYEEEGTNEFAINGKTMPTLKSQPQSSSSANNNRAREVLHVSSAALGEGRRRGRPLLRQPRIKRSDNEPSPGGGLVGSEPYNIRDHTTGADSNDSCSETTSPAVFGRGVTPPRESSPSPQQQQRSSIQIHQSNLPILRVSQCSPTPPSSPQHTSSNSNPPSSSIHIQEQKPVIVSTMSVVSSISGSIITPTSSSAMVITPTPHTTTTLLKVPSTEAQIFSNTSQGNQLVKQISQPLLPSHTLSPLGGITTGNPVIRRQNSTPAPSPSNIQQQQQQQSRIVQPLKQGTIFQFMPSTPERALSEESTTTASRTFIIDLQSPSHTIKEVEIFPRRELKKESSGEQSGSFSRDDSTSEDIGSSTSSSSFDEGLPVNRSGHCPVLRPGPALGCNFCWNSVDTVGRILRRKTKYHCPECHINLCIVPCFQDYHEKSDKKKKPRSKLGLPKPSSM